MKKICKTCNEEKTLISFFLAPKDGAASWLGSSMHCIECHDSGLVEHGYGWYGEKYRRPSWVSE